MASRDDRRTPRWFFHQCEARYGRFALDVAANRRNHLTPLWLGPGSPVALDGLAAGWRPGDLHWCNPPYGPPGAIEDWIAKARRERDRILARTLLLLPSDTSTQWFHDVRTTESLELVRFRLAFAAPDQSTKGNSAKFGSVLVYIAPQLHRDGGMTRDPHIQVPDAPYTAVVQPLRGSGPTGHGPAGVPLGGASGHTPSEGRPFDGD